MQRCYVCNNEYERGWVWSFGDNYNQIKTCSDACYMYSRLILQNPKYEDYIKELKKHHPKWIEKMKHLLDPDDLEQKILIQEPKLSFWQKLINLFN